MLERIRRSLGSLAARVQGRPFLFPPCPECGLPVSHLRYQVPEQGVLTWLGSSELKTGFQPSHLPSAGIAESNMQRFARSSNSGDSCSFYFSERRRRVVAPAIELVWQALINRRSDHQVRHQAPSHRHHLTLSSRLSVSDDRLPDCRRDVEIGRSLQRNVRQIADAERIAELLLV